MSATKARAAAGILAAGSSVRLGEDKVTADLGGAPLVCWSLAAVESAGVFDQVVVVVPTSRMAAVDAAVRPRSPFARVVAGGATRTASAWAALDATSAPILALHDAARPFAPPSLFVRCVEAAERDGSGVAGVPLVDTVRRADQAGLSVEEFERQGLWLVQTPQAFRREVLERARAAAGERSFSDDAAAVAAAGMRTRMVLGERRNLKVTTPEDLAYARELVAKGLVAIAGAGPRALPR